MFPTPWEVNPGTFDFHVLYAIAWTNSSSHAPLILGFTIFWNQRSMMNWIHRDLKGGWAGGMIPWSGPGYTLLASTRTGYPPVPSPPTRTRTGTGYDTGGRALAVTEQDCLVDDDYTRWLWILRDTSRNRWFARVNEFSNSILRRTPNYSLCGY